MYSSFKSVQLLVALLKKYGIKKVVLSPGGSDIPIIHSLEEDPYFECFSVVDERSAVYFAIGVSQVKNAPVACVCTSGTAACNYLPGLTEAFYQDVPIVAVTADKNPYFTNQLETQKIEQDGLFNKVCKKSVNLPLIHNEEEYWYCERLISEALFEQNHHGSGPVHINIPIVGNTAIFDAEKLPDAKGIALVSRSDQPETWHRYAAKLSKGQKILIVVGQNVLFSDRDKENIQSFFHKYNCLISVEHMSNLQCEGCVYTYPITETRGSSLPSSLVPDLVISIGNNISAYGLKPFLRKNRGQFEHWSVDEAGRIRDVFQGLTDVFECAPGYFFESFVKNAPANAENDRKYYSEWKDLSDAMVIPAFEFSNFYVAQKLAAAIPANSVLHLAILNSTRVMQFFHLDPTVRTYSNIGALGIDGCLSTFMGHAAATENLAFCVIGDLSFFYDMNAAGIRHVGKNVRIILLNNGGGSEFHFFMGKKNIPTINDYICAKHDKTARSWVESLGYRYYAASAKEEFDKLIPEFVKTSDAPLFIEVFTDMENDAQYTHEFYDKNGNVKSKIKNIAKLALTPAQLEMAKKLRDAFISPKQ